MKALVILFALFSFNFAQAKKANAPSTKISINTQSSKISWAGEKIIPGKGHKGTLKVKSGIVSLDKGTVVAGEFIVDMNSIDNTDQSGSMKKKLEGHLKSPDFFDVKSHPTAVFKSTKVVKKGKDSYAVTGDLTIRGTTNQETITLKVTKANHVYTAEGKLNFDRKKYKIQYNSEADFLAKAISIPKDRVIKDTVSLDLSLKTVSM